jgi:transposase
MSIIAAGVDIGRDSLDVAIAPSGRVFRAPNVAQGIKIVVDRLKRAGVSRVVLESIGTYGQRLVRALAEAGFEVGVVDPRRIKALRLAEGKRAKTDRLDAKLIARFALLMRDAARPVPDANAFKLRALSTRRRQLVEMTAGEKTRLKQALDPEIVDSIKATLAALTAERARVDKQLEACARLQPSAERRRALLMTAPGVGPTVAVTLLADLPELGQLNRKAIASLAGLAPQAEESGTRTGQAHISGGRPCVRVALYLAALSAVRCDPALKARYQGMRAAGKPTKVALIAIARHLLTALNAMLAENRPWTSTQPNPR